MNEWIKDNRGAPVLADSNCWRSPDGHHEWEATGETIAKGMREMRCRHCSLVEWHGREDAA